MKRWVYIILVILVTSCADKQDGILPEERSLTESVYASATIQPENLYQVFANVSGILEINFVDEGDIINKGEQLMQVTNTTPKLNAQNTKLALNLAKENYNGSATIIASIEDEIRASKLKYKNDSINYFRQKNLWNQNIGSKVKYDTKKLNYELASNQLNALKNKLSRTKNELLTAVKQAQNNYQSASVNTKDFTIKSKINGKVYGLYKEPGELVTSLEPLATIGSSTKFIIEMLVDEVDIVRVSEGQNTLITLDAYSGRVFKAKIFKIYPKKDERNQTFTVEAIFESPPRVLYPGLSGEASIIIATKESTLTIPKAYLIEKDKVRTEQGLKRITIGLQNMEFIEVLTGLTKDTYIYKPE